MMNRTEREVWGRAPAPAFYRWVILLLIMVSGAVAAVWIWASTIPVLLISQTPGGRVLFQSPVDQGSRFSLAYIHSIHRTPVEELFVINGKREIVLDAMIFESYGVGMPSSLEGHETFRMEDGKMRIENIDRTLQSFDLRIGQVIANHKLLLRGQEIPLAALGKPGSAVRFEIGHLRVWDYLKGGLHLDR